MAMSFENESQSMEYIKATHVGVGNIYAKSFEPVIEKDVQVVQSDSPLDNSLVLMDKSPIKRLMKSPIKCEPFDVIPQQELQDLRSSSENFSSSKDTPMQ